MAALPSTSPMAKLNTIAALRKRLGNALQLLGRVWASLTNCLSLLPLPPPPQVPWYRSFIAHLALGGFTPFSAISVELFYIFSTLWGREQVSWVECSSLRVKWGVTSYNLKTYRT